MYKLQKNDRTLQFSTLSFDICIEEIFPPLTTGGTVILRPATRSEHPIELSDVVERFNITALHLATGYWHEWVDLMGAMNAKVPACLRLMVVTGEKVSVEHYQRWSNLLEHKVLWANAYGPTEATVSATVFIPPDNWQGSAIPIGKALPDYTTHILSADKQTVADGQTGELYIGGKALAQGYLNRPEQTEQAFHPDPFSTSEGAMLYKTGDLAYTLPSGDIHYAGRTDHQIKLGSYRIEPGEIENTINAFEAVTESMVVVIEKSNSSALVAYIASNERAIDSDELVAHLKALLPSYMLPMRYVFLERLPKTINGKTDREALLKTPIAPPRRKQQTETARTNTEQQLCTIWQEVIGIDDVGVNDNFSSLGGDSLIAVRAIAQIQKKLNYRVSTRDFFFMDTVALLAAHISGEVIDERQPPAPETGYIDSDDQQIYTVLAMPSAEQDNGRGILLIAPPGNEHRRVQRPFRSLMKQWSSQGYTVMRFDWCGIGNSGTHSESVTHPQTWLANLHDAAAYLSNRVSTIDVIGIRLGALLMAQTSFEHLPIRHRIYWEPVINAKDWIDEIRLAHTSVLKDTFRFLKERKPESNESNIEEFTELRLHDSMLEALAPLSFFNSENSYSASRSTGVTRVMLNKNNTPTRTYFETSCPSSELMLLNDTNDWTNPRTTTKDMLIVEGTRHLASILSTSNELAQPDAKQLSANTAQHRKIQALTPQIDHSKEIACSFGDNRKLAGVYTPASPDGSENCQSQSPCAIFITAGFLHHVGPSRLHVEMSRSLASVGIAGLRFDLSGIGDSESNSAGGYFTERSVSEITQAMDMLESTKGIKKFVLIGLCSGADDALATALEDSRVTGLVLLNGYCYRAGFFQLHRYLKFYLPRMLNPKKVRNQLKLLLQRLKIREAEPSEGQSLSTEEIAMLNQLDEDYRYIPSREKTEAQLNTLCQSQLDLLCIYTGSEHDNFTYTNQFFAMFPSLKGNAHASVDYIPQADHTLVLKQDRDRVIATTTHWFEQSNFKRVPFKGPILGDANFLDAPLRTWPSLRLNRLSKS